MTIFFYMFNIRNFNSMRVYSGPFSSIPLLSFLSLISSCISPARTDWGNKGREGWQHGRQSRRIWHIHYNYSPALNRPIDVLKSKQNFLIVSSMRGTHLTDGSCQKESVNRVSYKWCIWLKWPFTRTQSKTVLNTAYISLRVEFSSGGINGSINSEA